MSHYTYEPLTALDQGFLALEGHNSHMHLAAAQIFDARTLTSADGVLDMARLREYIGSRLHLLPRYRQRLDYTPGNHHPIWVDDRRFNLFYHVRHTRLPSPGDERQLKRLVGRIMSQQLDRGKPLWEMWVIEGLPHDRFALLTKTHHCMIDGISGVDVMAALMTPEPTEKIEPPPRWIPRPAPSRRELARGQLLRAASLPLRAAGGLQRLARNGAARHDLGDRLRALRRMLETGRANASNTPLNRPLGPYRRVDWFQTGLDEIRTVRRRFGGTVNDVVLATVAGGVGRFLAKGRHLDIRELDFRAMTPVSMRREDERGMLGNRVSTWIVPLPVDELDPRLRLERVRAATEELKASRQALAMELLTAATRWTGGAMNSLITRLSTWGRPFNVVVTNVPGPPIPLYMLDAKMLRAYPMVPLFGNMALGIALFSYAGTLYWGVMADWDLLPDLHDFVLDLQDAFLDLIEAAGSERAAS